MSPAFHVSLDGISRPSGLRRLPVQDCAHAHSQSFFCIFVLRAFGSARFPTGAVSVAYTPPVAAIFFKFISSLQCRFMGGQGHCTWTPDNLPLFHSPVLAGTPEAVGSACTPSAAVGSAYTPPAAVGSAYTPSVAVGSI